MPFRTSWMRVSLVLEPPATFAVLSEINSLCFVSLSCPSRSWEKCDARLEIGELTRKVILGLGPQLGGFLQ